MTQVVVQKYGGSSLASLDAIRQVAESIVARKRTGVSLVVVVSAMGKATEGLLREAKEVNPTPPDRELDMLVTAGERISMALMSMAIHRLGMDAISLTGSQSGILTTESHQDAQIVEIRPHRIVDAMQSGKIVIVAGFQGMSRKRKEITSLGRGGSDTTAVALAGALGAKSCEIYSDVDGVYSADPRVCPKAKHLKTLHLETMHAMAKAGARVLNATAVGWARQVKVAIEAHKTHGDGGRHTEIHTEPKTNVEIEPGECVAVVGSHAVSCVNFPSQYLDHVLTESQELGGRIVHCRADALDAVVWIDRSNMLGQRIDTLEENICSIVSKDGAEFSHGGAVSVVGHHEDESAVLASRAWRFWRQAQSGALGAELQSCATNKVAFLGSTQSWSFAVPGQDVDVWVRSLHRGLVEEV